MDSITNCNMSFEQQTRESSKLIVKKYLILNLTFLIDWNRAWQQDDLLGFSWLVFVITNMTEVNQSNWYLIDFVQFRLDLNEFSLRFVSNKWTNNVRRKVIFSSCRSQKDLCDFRRGLLNPFLDRTINRKTSLKAIKRYFCQKVFLFFRWNKRENSRIQYRAST